MDNRYKKYGKPDDVLIEECAELIQILCKIKRFGLDNYHPHTRKSNIEAVLGEMDDVLVRMDEYRNYLKQWDDTKKKEKILKTIVDEVGSIDFRLEPIKRKKKIKKKKVKKNEKRKR